MPLQPSDCARVAFLAAFRLNNITKTALAYQAEAKYGSPVIQWANLRAQIDHLDASLHKLETECGASFAADMRVEIKRAADRIPVTEAAVKDKFGDATRYQKIDALMGITGALVRAGSVLGRS